MKIQEVFKIITSKNYKAYLLFLILTLILWFAIQLTKSYNYQNKIVINLTNIPNQIVLDSSEQILNVKLKSNGFKLWRYNMTSNSFNLDYNDFVTDSFQLKMNTNKIISIIADKYEFNSEDISLDQTEITFNFKRKQTKKVPVKSNLKLRYASGFNTIDSLKVLPDSIIISGANKDLQNINAIGTKVKEIKNINDTIDGVVELVKPNVNIKLSKNQVGFYLPVEKFSEKALMIDIKTINVPDSLQLNVFPNKAKVSFLVALKSFDKVSEIDFEVICDYEDRYQEDAIMIPKLRTYPDNILNPKLHIRKVDYLVKEKS